MADFDDGVRLNPHRPRVDPPMVGFERATAFAPYAGLFNVTGQPGVSIPWGIGSDGLPTAVQLVGAPLGEDTLLQLAHQVEQAQPWAHLRPEPVTTG